MGAHWAWSASRSRSPRVRQRGLPIWLSAWSWATPHAIRLANTAVNQILAAGPLASDRQLLLRDYVADSPNRTVARTSPRLVV
jgi:hypothetical protein